MSDLFLKGLEYVDVSLNEEKLEQFDTFYNMLIEKNKVMNLTTITEYDEVVQKHFVDSLSLNKYYKMNQDLKVIDVGTGAGFPGIPLKIAFEDLNIVLLDSLNKRVNFLNEVIEALELKKIEAVHGRAEDIAKKTEYREQFDICVSRAVANLTSLAEYCLPFVKKGGYFVSYKSGSIEEEINESKHALSLLGGKIEKVEKFNLPNSDIERSFVFIKKEKNTPGKYPRKAGLPTKEPLK